MRRAITMAAALALVLAGCGSADVDGGTGTSDEGTVPGEDTSPVDTGVGAELEDGLVVPEGATLAGTVFRLPAAPFDAHPLAPTDEVPNTITPPELGPTSSTPTTTAPAPRPDAATETWAALLTLEGDPFTVWDALAGQAREVGLPVGGSAAACTWVGGDFERSPVIDGEPAVPIDHLVCAATAADGERVVTIDLHYGGDHPGTIQVDGGPASRATGPADTAAVDDEARDLLPEPAAPDDPAPGDPFGGEGNCFVGGYRRFPLPDGATLVATQGGFDGPSVLAVDEVDLAIDDLQAAAFAGDRSYTAPEPRELPLADGRAVVFSDITIDAGGGACDFLGSPDGRFLYIRMYSN